MKDLKYSRQREAVLDCLKSRTDHPTAEMVYREVREHLPNVSRGTVYRNLALLCETGDLIKLSCGDGFEHYDYTTAVHDHFVCKTCGCVVDLEEAYSKDLDRKVRSPKVGTIENHSLIFYGQCAKCSNKIQNEQ